MTKLKAELTEQQIEYLLKVMDQVVRLNKEFGNEVTQEQQQKIEEIKIALKTAI